MPPATHLEERVARNEVQIGQLVNITTTMVETMDKGFKEVRLDIKDIVADRSNKEQLEKSNRLQVAGLVLTLIGFVVGGAVYGLNRENQFQDRLTEQALGFNDKYREVLRSQLAAESEKNTDRVDSIIPALATMQSDIRHNASMSETRKVETDIKIDFLLNEIGKVYEIASGKPYQFHSMPSRTPSKGSDVSDPRMEAIK